MNVRMPVFVVAIAIGQSAFCAEPDRDWVTDITPVSAGDVVSPVPVEDVSFNGFDQWRAIPDKGAPGSGGFGFQHYNLPMHHYTSWYRPRAATLTKCRRCADEDFRPRGFGNLFARPCDGYRMEYTPYQLASDESQYGPSYIARQPDQRCEREHCGH